MNLNDNELLKVVDIEKSFSSVPVLKKVQLDIKKGEVHALMGENGAGKSTLIKIITGAYTKDSGRIYYNGKEVEINSRVDSQALGIACIYQELSVIPPLTVAQNVLLGKEPKIGKTPLIDKKKMIDTVQKLIDKYDFPLNPNDTVEQISIGQRQLVEILKALSMEASLIIMDEPTASLSGKEAESLFSIINVLRDKGVSILYISHRLEEVYRLADRLTVLRDGKNIAVLEKSEIIPEQVIQLMIGKSLGERKQEECVLHPVTSEVVLDVQNLTRNGVFSNVSFQAHKGEILGFGGLIGSGRTELVRCIFGADKYNSGSITLDGKPLHPSTKECILRGFGFVPEDRRNQGFIPLLSVNKNVTLPNYDIVKKSGMVVSEKDEMKICQNAIHDVDIRPADPNKPVGLLSGGNQQKVVLSKWLARDLRVLIVDEPTAGIDVGAKDEIYTILRQLAETGVVVIVVSSDLEELTRISHRILIMRKGRIVVEFSNGEITQADILTASSGLLGGQKK